MASGDELTTYEKGIQQKFNSVSSSGSDLVGVSGDVNVVTRSTAIEQSRVDVDGSTGGDKENDTGVQAPIINEIKVNLIGDGVVELKRIDGSVSGTVFGNKSNQTEKPSAMDIARQIAASKDESEKESHKKSRRASVASVLPVGPRIKPKMEKSKTLDHPTKNDEIIIESRPGGTWFGSRRIKEAQAKISGEQIAETINKQLEQTALDALDQAVVEGGEDLNSSSTSAIQRKGASRDSYKNATTPDLERKEVKQMDKINEVKKRALKDESKELTKDEVNT